VLRHRCISEDQQVLCELQQTFQGLQAAVADEHSGRVHVALSTAQVQQADAFAAWLRKHAGLLQQLELDLGSSWMTGGRRNWVATSLAAALHYSSLQLLGACGYSRPRSRVVQQAQLSWGL
jgi:hypothetical protein